MGVSDSQKIIVKILFAYNRVKISYRKNFCAHGKLIASFLSHC